MENQKQELTGNGASKEKAFGSGGAAQPNRDYKPESAPVQASQRSGAGSGDLGNTLDKAKDTATSLLDQAKSAAGDAYDSVADKAATTLEDQKAGLSGGLTSVADTVRRVSGTLTEGESKNGVTEYAAQYTETAAKKLEQAAQYFESTDMKKMFRDVESYAKRNPAIFLGSAFALGVIAARFFRSSPTPTLSAGQFATGTDHQLTTGFKQSDKSSGTAAGM